MTNRELDCLIIGFATGSLACLWVGYWLRKRVERWHTGRQQRAHQRAARRDAKHIPFGDLADPLAWQREQDARAVLAKKPRTIPLEKRQPRPAASRLAPIPIIPHEVAGYPTHYAADPHNVEPLPCQRFDDEDKQRATETAQMIREDAIAALTGVGWSRTRAMAAVDACTLVERAGGLESWVAAAFRRATSKP